MSDELKTLDLPDEHVLSVDTDRRILGLRVIRYNEVVDHPHYGRMLFLPGAFVPPTPGNILVLQITERDNTVISDANPTGGFWTKAVDAHANFEIAGDGTAIFTHCVVEGDDAGPYGSIGETAGTTVSEWAIT